MKNYPVERFVAFVLGSIWAALGFFILVGAVVITLCLTGWETLDY